MIEPTSLSAGAIAVLVATKAFEATGEKLSDTTWSLVSKFLTALRQKYPNTATAIETAAQTPQLSQHQPDIYRIETLIHEVEKIAQHDSEVKEALKALADEVQKQQGAITNMSKLAEKIGTVVQGETQTLNIENNF